MSVAWQRAGWALGLLWLGIMVWWWWTAGERQVGPTPSRGPIARCERMAARSGAPSVQPMGVAGGCALWCTIAPGPDGRMQGTIDARAPDTLRGRLKCDPKAALQSLQETEKTSPSSSR